MPPGEFAAGEFREGCPLEWCFAAEEFGFFYLRFRGFTVFFALPELILPPVSLSHRAAMSGCAACMNRRCLADL